jgi:hypothetical protein
MSNYYEQQIKQRYAEADTRQSAAIVGGALGGLQRTATEAENHAISATSPIEQQVRRAGAMADNVRMLRNQLEERIGEVLGHPFADGNAQGETARPPHDSPLAERISSLADFLEGEARELQQLISRVRC